MSALPATAAEVSARFQEFQDKSGGLTQRLGASSQRVNEVQQNIESQWNVLLERANALLARTEAVEEEIREGMAEVSTEVSDLAGVIGGLEGEIEAIAQETSSSAETLRGRADELTGSMDQTFDQVDSLFSELATTANTVTSELGGAISSTDSGIKEQAQTQLDGGHEDVRQGAQVVREVIRTSFVPAVTEAGVRSVAKLQELDSALTNHLDEVAQVLESDTQGMVDEFKGTVVDRVDVVVNKVRDVEQTVQRATEVISGTIGSMVETSRKMNDAVNTSSFGVTTTIETIEEVHELFSEVC